MDDWKVIARSLYYESHMKMYEIAEVVNKTRQTVSCFIKTCPGKKKKKNIAGNKQSCGTKRLTENTQKMPVVLKLAQSK